MLVKREGKVAGEGKIAKPEGKVAPAYPIILVLVLFHLVFLTTLLDRSVINNHAWLSSVAAAELGIWHSLSQITKVTSYLFLLILCSVHLVFNDIKD